MKEILGIIIFIAVGLAQIIAGIQGIHFHFGGFWAFLAFISLFLGFSIPITIASFFGAMNVWGWNWFFSLLLAAPGLLFILPGAFLNFYKSFKISQTKSNVVEKEKSSNVGILISIFFILIFVIFICNLGQSSSSPNQVNYSQSSQGNYSPQQNYNLANINSTTNFTSLDEIARRQQQEIEEKNKQQNKKVILEKQIIDGVLYNVINNKYGIFYMTPPYFDATGYLVKVRFPNVNNYGIVAMTPTNCKVYNKRMKGESNLNPQLYLNGELQSVFDSKDEADFIVVANYICNYTDYLE